PAHRAPPSPRGLAVWGYTAQTPDPAGGVIQRREGSREPNGVLEETAFFAALSPLFRNVGAEGMKTFARAGADLWARYGYTTAEEGRSVPGTAMLLRQVADEGGGLDPLGRLGALQELDALQVDGAGERPGVLVVGPGAALDPGEHVGVGADPAQEVLPVLDGHHVDGHEHELPVAVGPPVLGVQVCEAEVCGVGEAEGGHGCCSSSG
ncbi:amidohydrolase family protein, partial [Nostoc sp. NIES-2111]